MLTPSDSSNLTLAHPKFQVVLEVDVGTIVKGISFFGVQDWRTRKLAPSGKSKSGRAHVSVTVFGIELLQRSLQIWRNALSNIGWDPVPVVNYTRLGSSIKWPTPN